MDEYASWLAGNGLSDLRKARGKPLTPAEMRQRKEAAQRRKLRRNYQASQERKARTEADNAKAMESDRRVRQARRTERKSEEMGREDRREAKLARERSLGASKGWGDRLPPAKRKRR